MILQRTRPPLLETPFEVFDRGVFTPNDQFFVRWHWAVIPERWTSPLSDWLCAATSTGRCRCRWRTSWRCRGSSWRRSISARAIPAGCSSRACPAAMGKRRDGQCAMDRRASARRARSRRGQGRRRAVRFKGLDEPVVDGAPDFMKSLDIDHARDGEVMLAYQMNGEQLPLLNGFPLRLIVPGWYSTYWVKMLNDIEVLDAPDDNYWMKTAYRIPDTPHANVKPGETGFKTVPINRMVPRSFFTNVTDGATVKPSATVPVRGIAFGGDCGVARVELSVDGGRNWRKAQLGHDEGKYGFRRWSAQVTAPASGTLTLLVRCTNTNGEVQPTEPNWNGGGFMRNVIESVRLSSPRSGGRRWHYLFETTAYGTVAVVAVVLFSIGTPAERFSQAPVTVTPISHAAPPTVGASGNGITLQSVSVEFPSSIAVFLVVPRRR